MEKILFKKQLYATDKTFSKINSRRKASISSEHFLLAFSVVAIFIYFVFLGMPIAALCRYAGIEKLFAGLNDPAAFKVIETSIKTSAISIIFIFLLGTPTVFFLSSRSGTLLGKILDILVQLPIVLPPAAAGIGLLLLFGSKGWIGEFLKNYGIQVAMSTGAVIIAQFFVSSAFYVQILKTAVNRVPKEIFEASYLCGVGKYEAIVRVILPMLKKEIIAGVLLCWIRAMGEFGATIMFAGNIIGKTRTIPVHIYMLMQSDVKDAAAFSGITFFLSFGVLLFTNSFLLKKNEMY